MELFVQKGEINIVNAWNNVMYYWPLKKNILLLSALNQNEQNIISIRSIQGISYHLWIHLFTPGCEDGWYIVTSQLIWALHLALPWCCNRHRAESMEKWPSRCDLYVTWHKNSGRTVGLTKEGWDEEGPKPHLAFSKQHKLSLVWKDCGCLLV